MSDKFIYRSFHGFNRFMLARYWVHVDIYSIVWNIKFHWCMTICKGFQCDGFYLFEINHSNWKTVNYFLTTFTTFT